MDAQVDDGGSEFFQNEFAEFTTRQGKRTVGLNVGAIEFVSELLNAYCCTNPSQTICCDAFEFPITTMNI